MPRHHALRHAPGYARGGVVNVFLATDPLRRWRTLLIKDQRTRRDVARDVEDLVDIHCPAAEHIVLVLDYLDTPTPRPACMLPCPKGKPNGSPTSWRSIQHGSWLNAVEIEFAALSKQGLDQRIGDMDMLAAETEACMPALNATAAPLHWQFRTAARIKLPHLSPTIANPPGR